ncbi:hypothetical protein Pla52o_06350 [Novipirellula galeiformis]|uniref:Uncharacterized protein n=1 Tax=Novipirellula galeiformis TaxID=2528004 RepID=A0A5C6CQI1_9BACT|nr:hypothetical protein [Novipirellula galeiformis]TWU26780.1 hypothetical protein Pla52o_06350 [Novipirellula galeiformis]
MSSSPSAGRLTLLNQVTCPHCWHAFAPEDSLWVSEHPDLLGDAKLGDMHAVRFLPSRFSPEGDAIDTEGYRTTRLACPNCHLEVSRPLYQLPAIFYSILGAPACGKSYFLASMTWQLRQLLPRHFKVSLNDADASTNARLHGYEEQQFLSADPDELVSIAKTETQGDLYDQVKMGDHSITLPRPFLFTLQPIAQHPNHAQAQSASRVICLYDNAGESFLPGADSVTSPVTRHLAHSACLFFCFDPTQDPRFRRACEGKSHDPQMQPRNARLQREASVRQDTILLEAISRVRRHAGLREDEQHQRPMIIVVTKWDSWKELLPELSTKDPYIDHQNHSLRTLDSDRIRETSDAVEALLQEFCPEIVASAQGFARDLVFVPVSATGVGPEVDTETGTLGIRPRNIKPYWVEVPMLYALATWSRGLIGSQRRVASSQHQLANPSAASRNGDKR